MPCFLRWPSTAIGLLLSVLTGLAGASLAHAQAAVSPGARALAPTASGGLPTLAPVVAQTAAGVVNISTVTRSIEADNPMFADPFFRRFFGIPERPRTPQAAGSGVIVDAARGYVLTNHHVIKGASQIVVTLRDRREFTARLVGTDPATDIALLQIPAERLTAVRVGDSDALQVGDYVLAIGNPFGVGQTVTAGIVSALGRAGLNTEAYEDFIQTDASINPGNSGGALINLRGELVGINTAIIGPAGGNVGIGFAVPSNMAMRVMEQLVRYGEVRRGGTGIAAVAEVTQEIAREQHLPAIEGAVIASVVSGSPAERAGLRRGDVVIAANGRPIRTAYDLRNQQALTPIGETLDLTVVRDGRERRVRVTVETPARAQGLKPERIPELPGAELAAFPREINRRGVYVADVERDSEAWQIGLRDNDVLLGINGYYVSSLSDVRRAIRDSGRVVVFNILRGDTRIDLRARKSSGLS
ncbi:MAG: Do family serine endopeptidase [Casimicrobiaceae bacterium]|nr:Do family serine endopeptidase [Casimicrobiaceae bacterium]